MSTKTDTEQLEAEIANAIEAWCLSIMKERTGPGLQGYFVDQRGRKRQESFEMTDVFSAIYEVCPDAIARMLQAGADKFLKE